MTEPIVMSSKELIKDIEASLIRRVQRIIRLTGVTPILATVLVGNDPASASFVTLKNNACHKIGMDSLKIQMPEDSTTEEIIRQIEDLNNHEIVAGILVQHPLPHHIDEKKCFNSISPIKDTDGVNTNNFGAVSIGMLAFKAAAPLAAMTLIKHYNIELAGKEVVVVGRTPILGRPLAMLLLNEDATVTICHSKSNNLPEIIKRADIVIAAVGKPKFIKADWIKEEAILIDTGYNDGNIGDIDLENAIHKASAYTPVPGSIGPLTVTMLLSQTVMAAEYLFDIKDEGTIK